MTILIFLIILAILILSHEFGHFIAAKRAGVRVDEFGLGFPPRLWGWKKGETTYSLNAIPFGGFVKIYGENPEDVKATDTDIGRSLTEKSRWIQAWVLVAGVTFNIILAWLLVSAGLLIGLPAAQSVAPEGYTVSDAEVMVVHAVPDSPADRAGLKAGMTISSIRDDEEELIEPTVGEVEEFIRSRPGTALTFSVIDKTIRATTTEMTVEISVTPEAGIVEGQPGIGIAMEEVGVLRLPLVPALIHSIKLTGILIFNTAFALGDLLIDSFRGEADLDSVTGPVGLVGVVGTSAALGFAYLLNLTALISINLAIINLFPFPALDGGRLLILAIEGIRRKPIRAEIANWLNTVGFALLLLLMAVITYRDIARLISG